MLAFAANSLLCRRALGDGLIDAASFASIRVLSGAVLLAFVVSRGRAPARRLPPSEPRDWAAAVSLFVYLVAFAFAYASLPAGAGALILFGAVQLTMLVTGLYRGERFGALAWAGFAVAAGGLVYLLSPGLTAPPLIGGLAMAAAGVAWGVYSLRGQRSADPLPATSRNFALAVPMVMAVNLAVADQAVWTWTGVAWATLSGTLASALGYVVWYAAVKELTALTAATVQLSVPVIAAAGGVLWLSEGLTPRLVLASIAVLGGIAVVFFGRNARAGARPDA